MDTETNDTDDSQCSFCYRSGDRCERPAVNNGLCYWHDLVDLKNGTDVRLELENEARSGQSMEGFSLQRVDLRHVNLVNQGSSEGYDLSHADLYRADLTGAHLFNLDLTGASLMKANLSEANLHLARLYDANLLGAQFDGAKIENILIGERLIQEKKAAEAKKLKKRDEVNEYFKQGEEIYRTLRNTAKRRGLFNDAGYYFYKEMVMRRYQMGRFSVDRLLSKLVDLICGYGEKPARVIVFALVQIIVSSLIYFIFGLEHGGQFKGFEPDAGLAGNIGHYTYCLYFSFLTFSTSGYSTTVPLGYSHPYSAFQRFISSFTLAMFVVVFIKKVTK